MKGAAVLRLHRRSTHERKTQLAQGGYVSGGTAKREAAGSAQRGRPAHGEAAALQHRSQASACRRCGLAVSQPCREHEEPARAARRTPTE